jgi:hypothetical protein
MGVPFPFDRFAVVLNDKIPLTASVRQHRGSFLFQIFYKILVEFDY